MNIIFFILVSVIITRIIGNIFSVIYGYFESSKVAEDKEKDQVELRIRKSRYLNPIYLQAQQKEDNIFLNLVSV